MAVIREDVVSIGFDVENNPFTELTSGINEIKVKLGILNETESGLKEVGREANAAAGQMDSLVDSIEATPSDGLQQPVEKVGSAAKDAQAEVEGLTGGLSEAGKQKLTDGIDALSAGLKNPKDGFKSLQKQAKTFAKEKLDAGIKTLPPQLQLGIKAGVMLAGALGKAAKVSFKTAASGVKSIATHAASTTKSLGKVTVKGLATGITAASVAVAGMGAAAITIGAGFESSMSQVAATMGMTADEADYSNEEYAMLANTAKEMGAATKFSAAESAEALNYMALAGYDAEKACGALPTVLNLASAGGMELAAASDMVTDSMSALGIEATQDNLTRFGDQLAKTAQKSNTSVAQLGEAVLTVGGTAKTLAGGTTELNTLLGIIADNGVKGAEGGTALRNIMLSLQAPTDTAAKKMKKLGLKVYDAEGKMRPMNDVLNDLNQSMDGMTDQKKQDVLSTIFNKNDLKSVNALLANSGARYDELSGYVENSAGAMENMAKTMNDNLTGKITEFKSAAEGAGIAVYEALGSGSLKGLVGEAAGWVTELTKATEEGGLEGLVGQTGTVLSKVLVTVTGYLPQLVQSGVSIISSLISGIMQNREEITGSVMNGLTTMAMGILQMAPDILVLGGMLLMSLIQGIDQQLPNLIPVALTAMQNLCAGLTANAPTMIQSGISIIMQLINGLVAAAPTILTTGVQLVVMLIQGLSGALPDLIAAAIQLAVELPKALLSVDWLKLGLDIIKGVGSGIVKGIRSLFGKNKDSGAEAVEGLAEGMKENTSLAEASAEMASKGITTEIDNTDLYGSGQDIMTGLNDGMLKMQPALNATAGSIGTGISKSLNGSLDIHSPSRVTEETGEYTGLGLVKGMQGVSGKVKHAAETVGDVTARNIAPYKSRYSPETGRPVSNSNSNQVNNWNPVFNLTLNGASASDSNERKVKRWVKESLKEAMEGMGRTNPRLQEV